MAVIFATQKVDSRRSTDNFCDKREQKELAHYAEWSKNLERSEKQSTVNGHKCRPLTVDFTSDNVCRIQSQQRCRF